MKNLKLLFLIALMTVFTFLGGACTHEEAEAAIENHATVTINSPGNDGIFKEGETILINVDAVGEYPLHGWKLKIVNKIKNTTVFEEEQHAHGTEIHLETKWVVKITEHTDMQLQVSAVLDHDGNLETKTANFHCYN